MSPPDSNTLYHHKEMKQTYNHSQPELWAMTDIHESRKDLRPAPVAMGDSPVFNNN